jgi:hypothetical protein
MPNLVGRCPADVRLGEIGNELGEGVGFEEAVRVCEDEDLAAGIGCGGSERGDLPRSG